ncbi:TPA_asm: hypothetical protein [Metorhabdovirus 1]|nr:TPA_asm: hypothetical protein [Metorhabdovirus 1]
MELSELVEALEETENTDRAPPIGDTTLRNPLVKRVFDILNRRESDATGHCRGMLREANILSFRHGTLDPTRWLALCLIRAGSYGGDNDSTAVTADLKRALGLSVESLTPICRLVVDYQVPPSKSLIAYATMSKAITMLVLKTATKDFAGERVFSWRPSPDLEIRAGFYTAELRYKAQHCIVPRDYLLMVSDIINARHQIFAYMYFCRCLYIPQSIESSQLAELFESGDRLLYHSGQGAFKRFKMVEPYTTARLIDTSGPSPFHSEFSDYITNEIYSFDDSPSQKFFASIDRVGVSPDAIANVFGLFRLWGHPILDSDLGRERVKKIACSEKTYDPQALKFAKIAFRKWVCLGYYRKHGRWPNLDLSKLPDSSEIKRAYNVGAYPNLHSKHYANDEWELVEGRPTFSAPTCLNTAVLLADKSHSLNRTALINEVEKTGRPGTSDQRRVTDRPQRPNPLGPRNNTRFW